MTRRGTLALATTALLLLAGTAHAQRASLAVGVASPISDFSNGASSGFDIAFHVRTDPIIGPFPLRIEIGYDQFPGKGAVSSTALSSQAVSVTGDFGSIFYWAAGPGYYQTTAKGTILGHQVTDQLQYFGTQAALGVYIPVFRWNGFLEVSAVKLYEPGFNLVYVPVRFGIRL